MKVLVGCIIDLVWLVGGAAAAHLHWFEVWVVYELMMKFAAE